MLNKEEQRKLYRFPIIIGTLDKRIQHYEDLGGIKGPIIMEELGEFLRVEDEKRHLESELENLINKSRSSTE